MDKDTQDAIKTLDKNTQNAFETLTNLMVKEFKSIRADMAGMATKQDIKELKDELRTIVREEVQDIRETIEERCKPTQIG